MTDVVAFDPGFAAQDPGTLVCEGDTCAVVGAGSDAAVITAAPAAPSDWLDGLLRKEISDQVDRAGASTPPAC